MEFRAHLVLEVSTSPFCISLVRFIVKICAEIKAPHKFSVHDFLSLCVMVGILRIWTSDDRGALWSIEW